MRNARGEAPREAYLQHAALDHDLHALWRNTGNLVDRILEDRGGLIGIQLHLVHFASVFDLHSKRGHGGEKWREDERSSRSLDAYVRVRTRAKATILMTNLTPGRGGPGGPGEKVGQADDVAPVGSDVSLCTAVGNARLLYRPLCHHSDDHHSRPRRYPSQHS